MRLVKNYLPPFWFNVSNLEAYASVGLRGNKGFRKLARMLLKFYHRLSRHLAPASNTVIQPFFLLIHPKELTNMDILSAAGYLIQRAVQNATQLQQQAREKEDKTVLTQQTREKSTPSLGDPVMPQVRSGAYRVTLSAAAQQRLMNSVA
ncbi:MAG: hypothetical protein H7834_13990 [Magnetococcus sp. YQC-9]